MPTPLLGYALGTLPLVPTHEQTAWIEAVIAVHKNTGVFQAATSVYVSADQYEAHSTSLPMAPVNDAIGTPKMSCINGTLPYAYLTLSEVVKPCTQLRDYEIALMPYAAPFFATRPYLKVPHLDLMMTGVLTPTLNFPRNIEQFDPNEAWEIPMMYLWQYRTNPETGGKIIDGTKISQLFIVSPADGKPYSYSLAEAEATFKPQRGEDQAQQITPVPPSKSVGYSRYVTVVSTLVNDGTKRRAVGDLMKTAASVDAFVAGIDQIIG